MIRLKAYGNLRTLDGRKELVFHADKPMLLADAVRSFADLGGERLYRSLFDQDGQLKQYIFISVNGHPAAWDESTWLGDGDEITLLPPSAGGQKGVLCGRE